MKTTREFGKEAVAVAATGLAALTLAACGTGSDETTQNAWNVTPKVLGQPQYLSNGTRELTLDSPRRDRNGWQRITESCLNRSVILIYDPEIHYLDVAGNFFQSYISPSQKVGGPEAEAACADGELKPGDPVPPVTDLPN